MGIEVPREAARAMVPSAFEILGVTTDTTAILIWINECERTLQHNQSIGPSRLYQSFVFASPKNSSWTQSGYPNYYALDPVTDNPHLRTYLAEQSVPVAEASFQVQSLPPTGSSSAEHWSVSHASWTTTFDVALVPATNPNIGRTFTSHIWYGQGPFQRITYAETADADIAPTAAEVVLQGSSQTASLVPGGTSPYLGGVLSNGVAIYRFDGEWKV